MNRNLAIVVLALVILSCLLPAANTDESIIIPTSFGEPRLSNLTGITASLFTENVGQVEDTDILFYASTGSVAFTLDSVLLYSETSASDSAESGLRNAVSLTFMGSNAVEPMGLDPVSWRSNHFYGNDSASWHTNVSNYRAIIYQNLWDGIDAAYHGHGPGVKCDFIMGPGADHGKIKIKVQGHESLSLAENGDLLIGTGLGPGSEIIDSGLEVFYADSPSERIQAEFVLHGHDTYGFSLQGRDMSRSVIIDPLVYSTFLGGAGSESGTSVALDSEGNAYVTGHTDSARFSTATGTFQAGSEDDHDVFVLKVAPDGNSIVYATFLGGQDYDAGHGIAVDSQGQAHVTGVTFSSGFPVTAGAFSRTYGGVGDAFAVKLGSDGDSLLYSTFLGGRHDDVGHGIAVDDQGQAHIAGHTWSSDFPITQGAFGRSHNGDSDAFAVKLSDTGDYLVYSTFLGGSGSERGTSVALDGEGNAYIAGQTGSGDFPATPGALNTTAEGTNVFVTKLGRFGNSLSYSAVFGGNGSDMAKGIAVDSQGQAHVTGDSDSADFPITAGARTGSRDIFMTKLDSSGESFVYSTRMGGSLDEHAGGISLGPDGRAFVTGFTNSADFPTTSESPFRSLRGGADAFVLALDPSAVLEYSSYLGGSMDDRGLGISVSGTGCIFVAGDTLSADFPSTFRAIAPAFGGRQDAFLVKLDITAPVAIAGSDRTVNESVLVELNGTASTDNEAIANHTWSFDDGTGEILLYGDTATHMFTRPGEFTITLKVTDLAGNTDTDHFNLTVLVYPIPIANAGLDIDVGAGSPVMLNGSASRDDVGITSYSWTFWDGVNDASTGGPTPTWLFTVPGVYAITLNVTDEDGNWDTDSVNVTVLDTTGPVAALERSITVDSGHAAILDGTGSTDDVGVVNHTWSFKHNGTEVLLYGPEQSFTFWRPGDYVVELTVSDAAGNRASNKILVTVSPSGGPGIADYFGIGLLILSAIFLFSSALGRRQRSVDRPREGEDE